MGSAQHSAPEIPRKEEVGGGDIPFIAMSLWRFKWEGWENDGLP